MIRKFLTLVATVSLVTGTTASPSSAVSSSVLSVKAKIAKPSAPIISAISSSAPKAGRVNVKVTIILSASNGGSNITGSKVSLGSKTCTIVKTKTSCTIKSVKKGTVLSVYASSKNIQGFSAKSARVTYTAGMSSWTSSLASPAAPAVSDTPLAAPAPVVVLTCAAGGTCAVGDSGPGGGIVYYVDNSHSGFNCGPTTVLVCHYLEVAPSDWITGSSSMVWATGTTTSGNAIIDMSITNDDPENRSFSGIGLGYKNSDLIVAQNGAYSETTNKYAAGAACAYTGGSRNDWYLPTTAEINLLCQWNRGVTQTVSARCIGGIINSTTYGAGSTGFVVLPYWSSSELWYKDSWHQDFAPTPTNVGIFAYPKALELSVRPIRAF